jgi:Fe-S-cluster containining protein
MLASMRLPEGDSELVQIMDARLADVARRAGKWLACKPGCAQCCHGAFAIHALDVARLRAGLEALRSERPELAAEIVRRAQAWIAEYGAEFPGDPETGAIGESEQEREQFEEFANDAACPALDPQTGCCDVYAWRPMTCRVFGPPVRMEKDEESGLGCCELCFAGADEGEIAECEMQVPHEREDRLLEEMGVPGETVVAFALVGLGPISER